MFSSGYALIVCVLVRLAYKHTFRSDFLNKKYLTFSSLGWHVLKFWARYSRFSATRSSKCSLTVVGINDWVCQLLQRVVVVVEARYPQAILSNNVYKIHSLFVS